MTDKFKKNDLIAIADNCNWELKSHFNQLGVVTDIKDNKARVILARGDTFDLPFEYIDLIEMEDDETEQIVNTILSISQIFIDINTYDFMDGSGVVVEILSEICKRDFLLIDEDEEGFISTVEDFIFRKKRELEKTAKILEFKSKLSSKPC